MRYYLALLLTATVILFLYRLAQADQQTEFDCNPIYQIPQDECEVLVTLYNSTDGGGWVLPENGTAWLSTDNPCEWHGIICADGHVTGIELFDPNGIELRGAIPATLGNLSELTGLNLANNRLTGPIPPELGNLSLLRYLNLGSNDLGGTIPPEIGNLSALDELSLAANDITDQRGHMNRKLR